MWHIHLVEGKNLAPDCKSIKPFVTLQMDTDSRRKKKTQPPQASIANSGSGCNVEFDSWRSIKGKYSDANMVMKVIDSRTFGNKALGQRSLACAAFRDGEVHHETLALRDDFGLCEGELGEVVVHLCWDEDANAKDEKTQPFKDRRRQLLSRPTQAELLSAEAAAARAEAIRRAEAAECQRLEEEAAARQRAAAAAAAEAQRAVEAALESERAAAAEALRQAEEAQRQRAAQLADMQKKAAEAAAAAQAAMDEAARAAARAEEEAHLRVGRPWNVPEGCGSIAFGFQWDADQWDENTQSWNTVDLDASAIVFDSDGKHIDTCYFGALSALGGAVAHSGDLAVTGASSGDVETITVNLNAVPSNAHTVFFVVSSFCCANLQKVSSFSASVTCDGKTVGTLDLPCGSSANAMLLGRLSRSSNGWTVNAKGELAFLRAFGDVIGVVQSACTDLWPNPSPVSGPPLLSKGQTKLFHNVSNMRIGLAWDFKEGENIDLDASLVTMDAKGDWKEKIFYNKLVSDDGNIKHHGDARDGKSEGLDEMIDVNLANLPANIHAFGICITSNTQTPLNLVTEAHCSVLVDDVEVARYSLTDVGAYTAVIVAVFHRGCQHNPTGDYWSMAAFGRGGYGKSVSYCVEGMQGLYLHHMNPNPTQSADEMYPLLARYATPENASRKKKKVKT